MVIVLNGMQFQVSLFLKQYFNSSESGMVVLYKSVICSVSSSNSRGPLRKLKSDLSQSKLGAGRVLQSKKGDHKAAIK
jgi:hypothetical protein